MFSRIFLISFGISVLLLGMATSLSPFIVDPYGLFQWVNIEGFNNHKIMVMPKSREQRTLASCIMDPDTVIFGSSRGAIGMSPEMLSGSDKYGKVYNLSTPSMAMPEIPLTALHALHAAPDLKRIMIGLDFLMFNAYKDFVAIDHTQFSPDRLILDEDKNCWDVLWAERDMFFGATAIQDSYKTILGDGPREYLTPAGQMAYVNGSERGIVPRIKPNNPYPSAKGYMKLSWRPPPEYRFCMKNIHGDDRLDDFRSMIREAYSRNVKVDVFFSPLHTSLYQALYAIGLWPQFEAWKRAIVTILYEETQRFKQPEPVILDYAYANRINNYVASTLDGEVPTSSLFFNESHYGETIGNWIQEDFLVNFPTRGGFGMLLSPDVLVDALTEQRKALFQWQKTHPKSVEWIGRQAEESYADTFTIGCSPVFSELERAKRVAIEEGDKAAIAYLDKVLKRYPKAKTYPILAKGKDGVPVGTSNPRLDLLSLRLSFIEKIGNPALVLASIRDLLEIMPDNLTFLQSLVESAKKQVPPNFDAIIEAWSKIIRLQPEKAEHNWHYGLTLQKLNRHTEAIEVLSKGLEVNPKYGSMYSLRALSYEALGLHAEALQDYEMAASIPVPTPPDVQQKIHEIRRLLAS